MDIIVTAPPNPRASFPQFIYFKESGSLYFRGKEGSDLINLRTGNSYPSRKLAMQDATILPSGTKLEIGIT